MTTARTTSKESTLIHNTHIRTKAHAFHWHCTHGKRIPGLQEQKQLIMHTNASSGANTFQWNWMATDWVVESRGVELIQPCFASASCCFFCTLTLPSLKHIWAQCRLSLNSAEATSIHSLARRWWSACRLIAYSVERNGNGHAQYYQLPQNTCVGGWLAG